MSLVVSMSQQSTHVTVVCVAISSDVRLSEVYQYLTRLNLCAYLFHFCVGVVIKLEVVKIENSFIILHNYYLPTTPPNFIQ